MKLKVIKNKISGETVITYYSVKNKLDFRYALLNRVLEKRGQTVVVVFDTNRRVQTMDYAVIDNVFTELDISFDSWSVKKDAGLIFGVPIEMIKRKQPRSEKMYVLEFSLEQFSKSLFERILQYFDIAIGFGKKVEADAIREALKIEPIEDVIFGKEYFEQSLYDSIVCSSLKSSFDTSGIVEEVKAR